MKYLNRVLKAKNSFLKLVKDLEEHVWSFEMPKYYFAPDPKILMKSMEV